MACFSLAYQSTTRVNSKSARQLSAKQPKIQPISEATTGKSEWPFPPSTECVSQEKNCCEKIPRTTSLETNCTIIMVTSNVPVPSHVSLIKDTNNTRGQIKGSHLNKQTACTPEENMRGKKTEQFLFLYLCCYCWMLSVCTLQDTCIPFVPRCACSDMHCLISHCCRRLVVVKRSRLH